MSVFFVLIIFQTWSFISGLLWCLLFVSYFCIFYVSSFWYIFSYFRDWNEWGDKFVVFSYFVIFVSC